MKRRCCTGDRAGRKEEEFVARSAQEAGLEEPVQAANAAASRSLAV
jgi:hypothetical protein